MKPAPTHYTQACQDAMVHYVLMCVGIALSLVGLIEVIALQHDWQLMLWACLATCAAVWWTGRMQFHAEAAERRTRMWR